MDTSEPHQPAARATPSPLRALLGPLLILFVILAGYSFPTRLPLVGEETCRAQHGIEMSATGDWLSATQQGVEILDRPPAQYWMFAIIQEWIAPLTPMTVRTVALGIVLATALTLYWYTRKYFGEVAGLIAGVGYPTMGHIFDLGRRIETDSLFVLLLVASLLTWHAGYMRDGKGRRFWSAWAIPMLLGALAALAKGTQAPVAFFGAIYLYLVLRERNWAILFNWRHFAGLAIYFGAIAIWQVPFYLAEGWVGTKSTWLEPGSSRLGFETVEFIKHLFELPAAVFIATLPWSPLLIPLLDPRFRRKLEPIQRRALDFLLLSMLVIFLPVWLAQGGHHRYVMPMYALMSAVAGIAVHRCLLDDFSTSLRRFWRDYLRCMGAAMLGLSLAYIAITIWAAITAPPVWVEMLQLPLPGAAAVAAVGLIGSAIVLRRARAEAPREVMAAVFCFAAFIAAWFNGPILAATIYKAEAIGPQVVAVRDSLPAGAQLISFEPLHHKFVYWYAEPIPILPWPASSADVPADLEYFAFTQLRGHERELPFAWQQLASLNMDRTVQQDPENRVIVGRRLPE
ncbi:MAG: ArnT family glycosyltransferase [Phycisphaerales bacterium JB039]